MCCFYQNIHGFVGQFVTLELHNTVLSGTFGVVHQGLNDDTGMAIAVKVMKRVGRDEAAVKELENEIMLMQRLDHPNIVRYLGCQVDTDSCYIFCEWVPCGSLADIIKVRGRECVCEDRERERKYRTWGLNSNCSLLLCFVMQTNFKSTKPTCFLVIWPFR
jgi:hypothetical protein